jgi:hypothetical protein
LKDHSSINQLPIFQGKALQVTTSFGGETSGSNLLQVTKVKYFVWSRGLGFENSPIKILSARKKQNKETMTIDYVISIDCGELRACKALSQAK